MREILIFGASLALAAPAMAQPPQYQPPQYQPSGDPLPGYQGEAPDDRLEGDDRDDLPQAGALPDPREMARHGQAMERMVGAVMDLPIGGIVAAVDPYGRGAYRPGDTVRDMATRDDPYAEDRIRHSLRATTAGMGALMEALARLTPVLRDTADQLERSVGEAMRGYDRGRPDYRGD